MAAMETTNHAPSESGRRDECVLQATKVLASLLL